jgi:hypothetical protein
MTVGVFTRAAYCNQDSLGQLLEGVGPAPESSLGVTECRRSSRSINILRASAFREKALVLFHITVQLLTFFLIIFSGPHYIDFYS